MTNLFSKWNALSLSTRVLIATAFGISKTGQTHVADNRIQSDGFNFHIIESTLTVEAIRNYLDVSESDPDALWTLLVAKMESPVGAQLIVRDPLPEVKPEQTLEASNAKPEKIRIPKEAPKAPAKPKKKK